MEWYLLDELLYLGPTINHAQINLGHFKTEQLQRGAQPSVGKRHGEQQEEEKEWLHVHVWAPLLRRIWKVGELTC